MFSRGIKNYVMTVVYMLTAVKEPMRNRHHGKEITINLETFAKDFDIHSTVSMEHIRIYKYKTYWKERVCLLLLRESYSFSNLSSWRIA